MQNTIILLNTRSGEVLAEKAEVAETFAARSKGLLGRTGLNPGEALLIRSCQMVHMFFMKFSIDVLFCSAENIVLASHPNLKPWRISKYVLGAEYVVELPAGTLERTPIQPGDVLSLERTTQVESS